MAFLRNYGLLLLVLVLGSAASLWGYYKLTLDVQQKREAAFKQDGKDYANALQGEFERTLDLMHTLTTLEQMHDQFVLDGFQTLAKNNVSRYTDLIALAWVPRVNGAEEDLFLENVRNIYGEFKFKRESSAQAGDKDLFPIYQIQPYAKNENLIGVELQTNAVLGKKIEQSIKKRKVLMTQQLELFIGGQKQFGYVLMSPVYSKEQTKSGELFGLILGIIRAPQKYTWKRQVNDSTIHGKFSGMEYSLYPKNGDIPQDKLHVDKEIVIGDDPWLVRVTPAVGYYETEKNWEAISLSGAGFLGTILIAIYLFFYTGRVIRIEELVKSRTDEIIRMTESLKEKNIELQHFSFVAGHDLQEPLRMISSYTKLLQNRYAGTFDESGHQFIEYIMDGINRMQGMIQGLLDYSRIDTQGQQFGPVYLEDCVLGAMRNLKLEIASTKAEISYGSFPKVLGDSRQLERLFQNLINNAIKFIKKDRIPKINISVRKVEKMWEISVTDNGIGIDSENYNRVFEIFSRLHTNEESVGYGVGLAVAKKIVDRHGGKIWVKSTMGESSTFYFTLPL